MAPTEGRVARPERRWGCRRGNPDMMEEFNVDSKAECDQFNLAHETRKNIQKEKLRQKTDRRG